MKSSSSSTDVVCIGLATLDHIYEINQLPQPDDAGIILSYRLAYGGRGVIPAVTLANLGASSALFTAVGRDFESSGFFSFLNTSKVDLTLVSRNMQDECYASNLFVETDTGEACTFFQPRSLETQFTSQHHNRIIAAKYVYIAINLAFTFEQQCLQVAKDAGISIVVNMCNGLLALATDTFLSMLIEYAEIIVFNDSEWDKFKKRKHLAVPSDLFRMAPSLMCVYHTKGAMPGVGYLANSQEFIIPIRPAQATRLLAGAGDTFIAGAIYGLLQGYDYKMSAQLGTVLASMKVEELNPILQLHRIVDGQLEIEHMFNIFDQAYGV